MEEGMSFTMRELTDAEKDEFLKNNFWGILCFGGDEPYGIPLGYEYGNGNVILGLSHTGRKMECVKRSRKVCLTICTPTSLSPNPREAYPFTSVIIDGELEEIAEADRASYGLGPLPPGLKVVSFVLKQKRVGTMRSGSGS